MKTFEQHRLKFQAKQPEGVGKTKRVLADNFFFPINACLHYQATSHQEIGMKGNNPLLHNWPKDDDIFLTHVEEGYGEVGKPKERNISSSLITNFFKGNVRFTRARRMDRLIHRPRNLIVFDYSLMQHKFHYTQSLKQDYYEFINTAKAYEAQINALGGQRENFLVIQLPTGLPERPDFMKVDKPEPDNDELVKFGSIGSYWLRELWLFCSGQGIFANIKHHEKLNLLLVDGRAFMSVNMALFKERAENESNGQKSIIQILDTFAEARTAVETEALPELSDDESSKGVVAAKAISNTPELVTTINEAVTSGGMTPKEAERFVKLAESSYDLPNPNGEGTIADEIKVTPEEYKISEELVSLANNKIARPEMKKSRTTNIVAEYVNKSLEKDIIRGIMGISAMGVAIKGIEKTESMDAANDFVEYKITTVLATGKQSTTRLKIPRVNENGEFKANNVTYKMAFSKVDAPIRKTKYNQAALTSYYGKVFVSRSDRSADDRSAWVAKKIVNFSLDVEDNRITKGRLGTNDVPGNIAIPNDYASIMRRVSAFTSNDKTFTFEYAKIADKFDENVIKLADKKKLTLCGQSKTGALAMGMDNVVYEITNNDVTPLGRINDVVGGAWGREPIDTHFVHIYGKRIPLGLVLGLYQGISGVLERTGIKYREVSSNIRSVADENEFKIRFKDKTLYVDRRNPISTPILSGFLATDISRYTMEEFESKGVYTSVLMAMGLHTLAIRELKLVREGFVDPKTREVLKEMKEPENYLDLLYRCADLLKDDRAPKETDPKFMKLRGYERIGGFIYKEFVDSIRRQRGLPNPSLGGIGIKPTAIWQTMVGDATTQLVQVVNPIHTLKEQEAVSLSGEGGRSAQSLVGRTRVFHKDDPGIFSESVPDSSKVGIRTFLTPNAAINSTLGTFGKYNKESGAVGAFSTTSNVFPASNHDDGKRANLASVQQSAVAPAEGYRVLPYLTGYESVMASRLPETFVFNAKQDGVVTKVSTNSFGVEYKDGSKSGTRLGVWHGDMAGKAICHEYVTDLAEGANFKAGTVLAWNKTFFERDLFSKDNVTYKTSALCNVALLESNDTLEDGCAIDSTLSGQLTSVITKTRSIAIPFENNLFDVKQIGDIIEYDEALFTMTDSTVGSNIKEEELKALKRLARSSPKAKYSGKITNVKVMYQGSLDDMSESLRALCVNENKRRKELIKTAGKREAPTAEVTDTIYFGGEEVLPNTVVVQYFIDKPATLLTGDKIVVGNQLKSIVGRIMVGTNKTVDGRDINLIFGWRSINARIVFSPIKIGAICTTGKHVMKKMLEVYKK